MKAQLLPFSLFIAVCFWASSCRKDLNKCPYPPVDYVRPVGIAFVGFTPNELDTLYVSHYQGGTDMIQLIGTDTIIALDSNMIYSNDTLIYRNQNNYDGFWLLKSNVDDIVFIPATETTFDITGTISDSKQSYYYQREPCFTVGSEIYPFRNIHINGTPVTADVTQRFNHKINAFIYLKK